jgi:hypothetical protein
MKRTHLIITILTLLLSGNTAGQSPDWLLDNESYKAIGNYNPQENQIELTNGLIGRTFKLSPNVATVGFDNLMTGETILRGVKPEGRVKIDGINYDVGGLEGQPNYAFLKPEWLALLSANPAALQFEGYELGETKAPFQWKQVRHHARGATWPPKGKYLRMDFEMPDSNDVKVSVHYELYDGIPVIAKWISVTNSGQSSVTINSFTSEIIAAVEYGAAVETRAVNVDKPNIHVETDYAFSSFNVEDANHHVVRWNSDPDYLTQVNYLRKTPCLLEVGPEIGPDKSIAPGETFQSFRTFVMPYDSYDRERQGLAL